MKCWEVFNDIRAFLWISNCDIGSFQDCANVHGEICLRQSEAKMDFGDFWISRNLTLILGASLDCANFVLICWDLEAKMDIRDLCIRSNCTLTSGAFLPLVFMLRPGGQIRGFTPNPGVVYTQHHHRQLFTKLYRTGFLLFWPTTSRSLYTKHWYCNTYFEY